MSYFRNSNFFKDLYYKRAEFESSLEKAKKSGYAVFVNRIRQLNNSPYARKEKGDISIQDIFHEHWNEFLQIHKNKTIRPSIIENVEKMINCHNLSKGFSFYECPNCQNFYIAPFTCKSRFCARCGAKYRNKIATNVSIKILKIPHRQLVFTIPCDLRKYFRIDRRLLSILFQAVNETMVEHFKEKGGKSIFNKEKRKLGFISFLHTYGRDMKWHPHIHVLYAEKFLRKDGTFGNWYYLAFEAIRKRFLYTLISKIRGFCRDFNTKIDKKELNKTISDVIAKYKNGAYFYGKQNGITTSIKSMKSMANYIARYASHPAISERRILARDKEKKTVTRFYEPHEDDTKTEEEKIGKQIITESVFKFIERLIIHIPDKGFQQVRYYGFYSNKTTVKAINNKKLFSKNDIDECVLHLKWKHGLLYAFGYDPLLCECGSFMVYNNEKSYIGERKKVPI